MSYDVILIPKNSFCNTVCACMVMQIKLVVVVVEPSLIVICMDPHSPNILIVTKYCSLILGDDTTFISFLPFFFVFMFIVMLCYSFCYYKTVYKYTQAIKITLQFFLVPECSVFRVLSTPLLRRVINSTESCERKYKCKYISSSQKQQ